MRKKSKDQTLLTGRKERVARAMRAYTTKRSGKVALADIDDAGFAKIIAAIRKQQEQLSLGKLKFREASLLPSTVVPLAGGGLEVMVRALYDQPGNAKVKATKVFDSPVRVVSGGGNSLQVSLVE
ncbi:hypothetical protein FHS95_001863 [Sphingomonas naasensis]|uniref:Uncharacterized protein n=1 Tax=Sphingomonas naasensis TaxID=1344951 RepID=A0A4S1WQK5_9SPHN|nr:hypothetical protein [Sphingomonas naasensis]NIJ20171.1 hypothetical protein [Sphingomonas naasensis]TGX44320.1 hypothetical protein E5A74_05835 [Sphingomonas naasensis]